MKRIIKILKTIWERPDIYWNEINTPTDNPKIEKAHQQIKEMLPVLCFIMASFIIQVIILKVNPLGSETNNYVLSGTTTEKGNEGGTGIIFFFWTLIFTLWVFVIVRIKNSHKHHSQEVHNPKEKH